MKKYYAFIGQLRTTCGVAHKITGRLNCYGDLVVFNTAKLRSDFIENTWVNNPSTHIYSTNKKESKIAFFGGLTLREFNEYLQLVNSGYVSISRFIC
jgi:hypothetical protein